MQSQEASEKLREVLTPYIGFSKRVLEPLKAWFHTQETTDLQTSLVPVNELARRMRGKLGHEQHA